MFGNSFGARANSGHDPMTLTHRPASLDGLHPSLPTSNAHGSTSTVEVPSGQARTNRFMHFALAGVRLLNCVISLIVVATRFDHYRLPVLVVVVYIGAATWSAWLFGWATRGSMITVRLLLVDVVVASVPLVVVGMATEPHIATDWTNWSFAYALSVVLAAGAVLRLWTSVLVAAWLAALYLGSVAPALASGQASLSNGLGNVLSFFAFALLAYALAAHLRRTASELDSAVKRALAAEAEQARYQDRITQYRRLHGTVLATLTDIASGTWDHRAEIVRARCERQASYLRRLIEGEVPDSRSSLNIALDQVIEHAAEQGLRIHDRRDDPGSDLPLDVVRAIAGATEEALTNIHRHAGVNVAWLSVTSEDGQIMVRIVDQGVGFDLDAPTRGFGVSQSIRGWMHEAGGSASLISQPGEGTWVELRWPAR